MITIKELKINKPQKSLFSKGNTKQSDYVEIDNIKIEIKDFIAYQTNTKNIKLIVIDNFLICIYKNKIIKIQIKIVKKDIIVGLRKNHIATMNINAFKDFTNNRLYIMDFYRICDFYINKKECTVNGRYNSI